MNVLALVYADFERDFFGRPSMLSAELAGQSVLGRTLSRLGQVEGLDGIILAGPAETLGKTSGLVQSAGLQLLSYARPESPGWSAMRAARSFGRYGWRGGLAGVTIFDEVFDTQLIQAVLDQTGADSLLLVPAGSALLDVGATSDVVEFHRRNADRFRMVFSQAPPGLGAAAMTANILRELIQKRVYPGKTLTYDPRAPVFDPIQQSCCRPLSQEVIATPRRFLADTPRGLWLCRQVLAQAGDGADGQTVCRIANRLEPEPWPRELTVELTTRRPVEDALRPWTQRADLPLASLRSALSGLEEAGDVNVMFAGAGDALLYEPWAEAVAAAKAVGAMGLATYGVHLDESLGRRILEACPDVLEVYVDAVSDPVYSATKRGGSAEAVWANLEAFIALRDQAGVPTPLVVPTLLKTAATIGEQEEFFHRCLALSGSGLIIEPTTAAGQWPDRAVVHMAPPTRVPCRRLASRLTLLSGGQWAACEEDFLAKQPLAGASALEVWRGGDLTALRGLHAQRRWDAHPICSACQEYHRP